MTKASFSFILRVSNYKGKQLKLYCLLLIVSLAIAAPKKKAPITNDEDFVPLKKSTPKTEPKVEVKPMPTETTTKAPKEILPEPPKETKTVAPTVAPKEQAPPPPAPNEISEVLISKSYLKVNELEPIPSDYVKWDDRNGKSLYIPKSGDPYILLIGRMKEKHSLIIDNRTVPTVGGNFEYKLVLPPEPVTMVYGIKKPDGKIENFHLNYTWIKSPGSIRVKVKEEETGNVVEKSVGFSGKIKLSASTQLLSDGEPIASIDNIQHKKLHLTFKIISPESDDSLESWALTIKNKKKETFSQVKKNGKPPTSLNWNDFVPDLLPPGSYTYRVSLFTKTEVFDGPEGKFEVFEGKILALPSSKNSFTLEPKEEIGYLTYKNNNSYSLSSLYVGSELPILLNSRFILRPGGLLALPTADPNNIYYSARLLGGMRFLSQGQRLLFFKTSYELQLDVLIGLTRFSLSPRATKPDLSHLTLHLEPNLVAWGEQYLTPVFEYSADTSFNSMRFSLGLLYQFYIKSWSLKWGTGVVYDNQFQDSVASNKYSLFRALSSFQFQL